MEKITFIAEIGLNHHGDIDKAKRMCSKAAECGATYIKSQFYNPYKVLGRSHPALNYALQAQFTRQQHEDLARYCSSIGSSYFVSVFDVGDVPWCDRFSSVHKVASRMNKNQEFIAKIDSCKKPVFMSVQPDMGTRIPQRFNLMWCVREYPTLKEDVLKYPYNANFGLSSHCPDITASLYALEQGATVLENHLVESKKEEGCDVASSITFDDYRKLISKTLETVRR